MTAAEGASSVTGLDGNAVTAKGGAAYSQTLTLDTTNMVDGHTMSMEIKYLDQDGKAQTATVTFTGTTTAADLATNVNKALQGVFGDGYTVLLPAPMSRSSPMRRAPTKARSSLSR